MTADSSIDVLQLMLSANAHGPVIKAIIETLGDGAVDEFANAVRLLDQRVGGELRVIETIASEQLGELKSKDRKKPRKQLERIVRRLIRRSAEQVLATKIEQERGGMWRTALAAVVLDIIRTHGAVDVLAQWEAQEQSRTNPARQKANQRITTKNESTNKALAAEAQDYSFQRPNKRARTVASHLKKKKNIVITPEAARARIRRLNPK